MSRGFHVESVCMLIVLALSVTICSAFAQSDAPKDAVLEKLALVESRLLNVRVALSAEQYQLDADGEKGKRAREGGFEIHGDFARGARTAYQFEVQECGLPWIQNEEDAKAAMARGQEALEEYLKKTSITTKIDYSFSNANQIGSQWVSKSIEYQQVNNDFVPARGIVASESSDIETVFAFSGNRLDALPGFFNSKGLSNYLKALPNGTEDWKVLESSPDTIRIWFRAEPLFNESIEDSPVVRCAIMTLDLTKGGVISEFETHTTTPDFPYETSEKTLWSAMKAISLIEKEGLWLPEHISFMSKGFWWEYHYTFEKINMPPEEVMTDLTFPAGLNVIDRESGQQYIADESPLARDTILNEAVK
jgi:hypothetical protein